VVIIRENAGVPHARRIEMKWDQNVTVTHNVTPIAPADYIHVKSTIVSADWSITDELVIENALGEALSCIDGAILLCSSIRQLNEFQYSLDRIESKLPPLSVANIRQRANRRYYESPTYSAGADSSFRTTFGEALSGFPSYRFLSEESKKQVVHVDPYSWTIVGVSKICI